MPVSLLIALFLAFGTDAILPPGPVPAASVVPRLMEVAGEIGVVGLTAFGFATVVVVRVRRRGRPTSGSRRLFAAASKIIGVMTLVGYAWIIHGLGWAEVVRSGLGLRDAILVDELLILLPFLLAQVAGWWGLYPAEMALRPPSPMGRPPSGVMRHLSLRARQTLGMVLPAALIFSLAQDVARRQWAGHRGRSRLPDGNDGGDGGRGPGPVPRVCPPELADPPASRRSSPRSPGTAGHAVPVPVHRYLDLGNRWFGRQRRGHGGVAVVPLCPADRPPDRGAGPAQGGRRFRARGRPYPPPSPQLFRLLFRGKHGRAAPGQRPRLWLCLEGVRQSSRFDDGDARAGGGDSGDRRGVFRGNFRPAVAEVRATGRRIRLSGRFRAVGSIAHPTPTCTLVRGSSRSRGRSARSASGSSSTRF